MNVLVTGSSRGLGKEIIKEFASHNYDVIINYNNSEKEAFDLADELKSKVSVKVIKCDISNEDEVKEMFEESLSDLQTLYKDIVEDLNQEEVNLNEYYLFFQNGKQTFPQYIEMLGSIKNESLEEVIGKLMNVFNNLNKIADAFPKNNMINTQ